MLIIAVRGLLIIHDVLHNQVIMKVIVTTIRHNIVYIKTPLSDDPHLFDPVSGISEGTIANK